MQRHEMIDIIGKKYLRSNIESSDEWSYVKDSGSLEILKNLMNIDDNEGKVFNYKLDIRFTESIDSKKNEYAILIETKHSFQKKDQNQLSSYVEEEHKLHPRNKVIAILANTDDDEIIVWKNDINNESLLINENRLKSFEYYKKLFLTQTYNNKEKVMKNTYELNEILHKMSISETIRSQLVGTCLLFIKDYIKKEGYNLVDKVTVETFRKKILNSSSNVIQTYIQDVLSELLDGTKNKEKKIELLKTNVLGNQHVKELSTEQWTDLLCYILEKIYKYIDTDSSEGQDILNLFFITFNKYAGKSDKNQAFTPDHITDFMTRITEINAESIVLDATCGSGSFLVQAMVKEFADVKQNYSEFESTDKIKEIKATHIFGIENEEKAYGLATTNMLIHGDGNSNIELANCFSSKMEKFISNAHPTVILMNPPYNAVPSTIPNEYKENWSKSSKEGKTDPTKGLVFVKYMSDIAKRNGWQNTKMAVLLPLQVGIGNSSILKKIKKSLLLDSTLDAVFTLPSEVFYPGASVQPCCMLFTLNKSHFSKTGKPNKKTYFGYCREDGFKKKKNLGRVEQYNDLGKSSWKKIEEEWVSLFNNKEVQDGKSAMEYVDGNAEWLCEAYMKTDYSKLKQDDFQKTINEYLSYLVKTGKVYHDKH